MAKTLRKNDKYEKKAIDGEPWRGCGEKKCPYCSTTRQNKKIKEKVRGKEILDGDY